MHTALIITLFLIAMISGISAEAHLRLGTATNRRRHYYEAMLAAALAGGAGSWEAECCFTNCVLRSSRLQK